MSQIIASVEELEHWLKSLPADQRQSATAAIATRSAMRVLPAFSLVAWHFEPDEMEHFTFPVFRAAALALSRARYPSRAAALSVDGAAEAAMVAAHATERSGAGVVRSGTAFCAAYAAAEAVRAEAGEAAKWAAETAGGIIATACRDERYYDAAKGAAAKVDTWRALTRDAALLDGGLRGDALLSQPLWLDGAPAWTLGVWKDMQAAYSPKQSLRLRGFLHRMLPKGPSKHGGWQVWLDWYDRRLKGVFASEEDELAFASVPESVRQTGARAANAWIAARLSAER